MRLGIFPFLVRQLTINLEFGEGIIDLASGELVSEGHQLSSEGLGVNLSILLERLERSENDIVVIRTSGHLGGEEGDHLGEVHGSVNLVEHGLKKHIVSPPSCFEIEGAWGGKERGQTSQRERERYLKKENIGLFNI